MRKFIFFSGLIFATFTLLANAADCPSEFVGECYVDTDEADQFTEDFCTNGAEPGSGTAVFQLTPDTQDLIINDPDLIYLGWSPSCDTGGGSVTVNCGMSIAPTELLEMNASIMLEDDSVCTVSVTAKRFQ